MKKHEILNEAIKQSADYVKNIKEIEERGVRKVSYQDGFVDGFHFAVSHPDLISSEAVEFAEWLHKGYTPFRSYADPRENTWTPHFNTTHGLTTLQLYKLFKTK